MILKMKQEHSPAEGPNIGIEYSFLKNNEKIASFYAKNPPMVPMVFEGEYKGKNNYKIILETSNVCPEGYKEGMLTYQAKKEDGTKIGISKFDYNYYNENKEIEGKIKYVSISPKKQKIFEIPKAYQYQEFTFKDQKYDMYDVRIRGTGMFYCIYKDNELIAMVEKDLKVINWLDNYTIYALDEIDIELVCLATAHYDYTNFEIAMPQGKTYSVQTGNATLEYRTDILDKYDSEFKQRIIEMEK